MRALPLPALLEIWERAWARLPAERAMLLLEAACPEHTPEQLRELGLGARDALLLSVREGLFGERLRSAAKCPSCGAEMELTFSAREIRASTAWVEPDPVRVQAEGFEVRFRLPNTSDLLSLPIETADAGTIKAEVVKRCILSLHGQNGNPMEGELPAAVIETVAQEIALRDAAAHTELKITCTNCGHLWTALLDIMSFLWKEIDALCRRLLHQVHCLASTYGWSEREILNLSPARRSYYLALLENG